MAEIRQQREEELKRKVVDETDMKRSVVEETDVMGGKRARVKRGGKDFYLPVRSSDLERARDQELLDALGHHISSEEAEEAVRKIRRQRDDEVAHGGVAGSSQGREGGQKKPRRASVGKCEIVGSLEIAMLQAQHREMTDEAQRHEAMSCFLLTGPHTSFTLLNDSNINVFPGFRNFGNTCWLNSLLQCIMHVDRLRREVLVEREVESRMNVGLRRLCKTYWALNGIPRHAVIAPLDVLMALILEWPQLGGALQQDVGEAMQFFPFGALAAIDVPPSAASFCAEGVVMAALDAATLQEATMSWRSLWQRISQGWNDAACLPEIIMVSFPTVYECPGEGFKYSKLVVTGVDEVIEVACASPRSFRLRAYIEHRHHGQPGAKTSRVGGHYVAHFRNHNVWYIGDDTATSMQRQQTTHPLPALAILEAVNEYDPADRSVIDSGAFAREPPWLQTALEILSALQMDSEWILALTEREQITIAEVVSAREQGIDLNPGQMDEVYRLLGGGSRGTAAGAFESLKGSDGSTDEDTDGEGEEDPANLGWARHNVRF